jgi:glycosyltransferase involved in cell wall biosynthesis
VKHIIFAVTNDLTHDQRMQRICTTLTDAGYTVTLIGRMRSSSVNTDHTGYAQIRLNCRFQKGVLFYLEYQIKLLYWLCTHRYDIISSVDTDTLLACTLAAIVRQVPLVYDSHEYFTEVPEVKNRIFVKHIWRTIENICMPITVKRYTVSHALAQIFTIHHQLKFDIIFNAPNFIQSSSAHNDTNNMFTLVYQGDINPGRGIDTAINAISKLDAHLLIIGDGPELNAMKELTQQLNVSHKVTFAGYQPYDEMQRLTSRCDIGLNLLDAESLSYYYSLSNKFFNYIHARIPQLCADFPEYRLINAQYPVAMLVNNSVEELIIAVNLLMHNTSQLHQMCEACHQAAQHYSWQHMQPKLVNIYDSIG